MSEWLGIPTPWSLGRLKDHVILINGYPFDSEGFNPTTGTPLIRIRDLLSGSTETFFDGYVPPEVMVRPGDLIVGMDGDFNAVTWSGEPAALNQRLCVLRAKPTLDQRYLAYLLPMPLKAINDVTYWTTVKHLSSLDLLAHRIPMPPIQVQRAIADYLDVQTVRIDALIGAERGRLALAQERLQSAVETLVLGREVLSPVKNAPEGPVLPVPDRWHTLRNKTFLREVIDLSESGDEELLSVSHISGVTPRSEKDVYMFLAESNVGYKRVRAGDLVINTMWAWMGALGVADVSGIVSPAYGVYRFTREDLIPAYFDALFRSAAYITEMTRYSKGVWTSRLRLYPESFLSLRSPVPPTDDQRRIASRIRELRGDSEHLSSLLERSVALLEEHRQALISAAVTGEIEVAA
jgi:type I restriction enzyme S subunit